MKRILLVNPVTVTAEATFYPQVVTIPGHGTRASYPPLGLATIAALIPKNIEVEVWDEAVKGRLEPSAPLQNYDLVALTGYSNHLFRAVEIARLFRQRGIPTVIGGPGISATPEQHREDFDVLFLGEAEVTWPQFLEDWQAGRHRKIYRQVVPPDMSLSPSPRWELFQMDAYMVGTVQATRGCPFDCEFCDVVRMFGRVPRHKSPARVLEEVSTLARMGVPRIFFCDDNFIGSRPFAKELLRGLIEVNRSCEKAMRFSTQLSINVARDEELLGLLADANFQMIFIGIESPNKESLRETGKAQNSRADLVADLAKIQSYGLNVWGSFIVGFDHDDTGIFDEQFEYIQSGCIPKVSVTTLRAPVGTKLWNRMANEGRLVQPEINQASQVIHGLTNIVPKRMSRVDLYAGYRGLLERIYDWDNFAARVKGLVSRVQRRPAFLKVRKSAGEDPVTFFRVLSTTDWKARRAIAGIMWHTLRHAPFMMRRICGVVATHALEVNNILGHMRETARLQIEREISPGFRLEIAHDGVVCPEPFVRFYKTVFPEVYQRVSQRLSDKFHTDNVIVALFSEFLARCQRPFEGLGEPHKALLFEIGDRLVTATNQECPTPALGGPAAAQPESRGSELLDAVLRAVEQQSRGAAYQKARAAASA